MKQICISRLDKMGDMILSLPAIKGIKLANPDLQIYVLASHQNAKVVEGLKYIDQLIIINTNYNLIYQFKKIINLRKFKFNFFINLSPTLLSYFFCFFSRSKNKATLIFLSRYNKTFFSKFFIRLISKIFCKYIYIINRYLKLKNNEDIHQTKMIFNLLKKCHIPFNNNTSSDISLPKRKFNLIDSEKKLIIIHLSKKWINKYYNEENFLQLVLKLPKKLHTYVLTTDNSTKHKFKKIYNTFKILNNNDLISLKKLNNYITILDKLTYENWLRIIYSSNQVITPECGCSHISAACKIPVTIIYDSNNFPEAIYNEYHPWKAEHKMLVFKDSKLNEKIINNLA